MSTDGKGFYQQATYLGQHFKISQGILKETACMGEEERLLIADLRATIKVLPLLESGDLESMDVKDVIEKIVLPYVRNEGHAKWQRDVVTDMAIKKGDTTKGASFKKGNKDKDSEIE